MATIKDNLDLWNCNYDWKQEGDEWSEPWGSVEMQWYFTIFPRIHPLVPRGTIVEIAPGYGRWTQFLAGLCNHLILVDLSEKCIERCKVRFKEYSHITYHVNDGKSLEMIPDDSVDFFFSFDSLVHAEEDVIATYIVQISKKLKKNAAAFIHHSNIGEYKSFFSFNEKLNRKIKSPAIKKLLCRLGLMEAHDHFRAHSMTANKFSQIAETQGLLCSQEIINWNSPRLIDCFSILKKNDGAATLSTTIQNRSFVREVNYVRRLAKLYAAGQ